MDQGTADVLLEWKATQQAERQAWGDAWVDSGRMFTRADGKELTPKSVSDSFRRLVKRYATIRAHHTKGWTQEMIIKRARVTEHEVEVALAGPPLPPVRFHDLRHGAATMLHAAGVSMKVVSEILGHSSESFTSDVYAVVAQELARDAAMRIAEFIPRRLRTAAEERLNVGVDREVLAIVRSRQRPGEDTGAALVRLLRETLLQEAA
ncbi:tyrosine-type recombinase/integrase [Spirillospora sp. NPDC127200]